MAPQKPRVLVIDDDDLVRALMVKLLRAGGFEVIDRDTPIGATQLAVRSDIAALVVDLHMPALEGDKLATLFRQTPKLRQLPIFVVSADEPAAVTATLAGMVDVHVVGKGDILPTLVPRIRERLGL